MYVIVFKNWLSNLEEYEQYSVLKKWLIYRSMNNILEQVACASWHKWTFQWLQFIFYFFPIEGTHLTETLRDRISLCTFHRIYTA